jgi:predicted naringenin-chalcone synthase
VGDHGFDIVLSSYVPKILGAGIRDVMAPLLGGQGLEEADIAWWAVHPGGRAILDKVESGLGLRPEQVAVSREVLRRYGNMSSATVLFVLKDLLAAPTAKAGDRVCAMAFGPGLTVESVVLELQGVKVGKAEEEVSGVGCQVSV